MIGTNNVLFFFVNIYPLSYFIFSQIVNLNNRENALPTIPIIFNSNRQNNITPIIILLCCTAESVFLSNNLTMRFIFSDRKVKPTRRHVRLNFIQQTFALWREKKKTKTTNVVRIKGTFMNNSAVYLPADRDKMFYFFIFSPYNSIRLLRSV